MSVKKIKASFKIHPDTIILICMLIPFIQSRTYSEMPGIVGTSYQLTAIVSATFAYMEAFRRRFKNWKVWNVGIFILFWAIYIFSTFVSYTDSILYVLRQAYIQFGMIVLLSGEIQKRPQRVLFALAFIYEILTVLNFALMVLVPQGLYNTSTYHTALLLGDDNAIAYVVLPGMVCVTAYSLMKYKKLKLFAIVDIIAAELSFFMTWSANAMVCSVLFIVLLILTIREIKFSPRLYLIAFTIAVLLCFFGTSIPVISNFIIVTLQKDITFGGRIYLWAKALTMFAERPVLGYGGFFQVGRWISGSWGYFYPCHTPYLQLMLDGGILLFVVFVLIIIHAFRTLSAYKSDKTAQVFTIGVFCIMINYIFEYSGLYHLFILCGLAINYKSIYAGMGDFGGS